MINTKDKGYEILDVILILVKAQTTDFRQQLKHEFQAKKTVKSKK